MLDILFSKKYWRAINLLTKTSIVRGDKNTILGSSWSVIPSFVHIVTITYFFGFLLRQPADRMLVNLVGALSFWNFLVGSLSTAANSLVSRESIIKRAIISKTYFPISDILAQVYTLTYSFLAMYMALIIFFPERFHINILLIPVLTLPLIFTAITTGIAVAFLTPYIRDIPQLVGLVLSVIYWTVPIIYPISLIPEGKKFLFEYHPIYLLIRPMQHLVTNQEIPSLHYIIKSWLVCLVSCLVNYLIYKKLARNVIYYL